MRANYAGAIRRRHCQVARVKTMGGLSVLPGIAFDGTLLTAVVPPYGAYPPDAGRGRG